MSIRRLARRLVGPLIARNIGPDAALKPHNLVRDIVVAGLEAKDFHEHTIEWEPDGQRTWIVLQPSAPGIVFDRYSDGPPILQRVGMFVH